MHVRSLRLSARLSFLAIAVVCVSPGHAQVVQGGAKAIDGDTLDVSGKRVRLFGIDAPESDQTCQKNGASWACGKAATEQLSSLVLGQQVDCRGTGVDQYGRMLAVCTAGAEQLNQVMVEQGLAVAYRQYSDDYAAAELHAMSNHLGIWSSTFMLPSDYRQSKLPPALASVPATRQRTNAQPPLWAGGCLIKGNRNRRGEWIYHIPGMPYYEQTRAEEMFCSEEQAQAAGYRRAKVK